MKTMKTVESRVLQILRDCPETRNEDMLLFYRYYNRYADYLRAGELQRAADADTGVYKMAPKEREFDEWFCQMKRKRNIGSAFYCRGCASCATTAFTACF